MGFLKNRFYKANKIEEGLRHYYIGILQDTMGLSQSEAAETINFILEELKKEAKVDRSDKLPDNFGDVMLEKEKEDLRMKKILDKKRKEGATDNDIRWWWNMHYLERGAMMKIDEMHQLAMFIKCREDGMNNDDINKKVRKTYPIYGDPGDVEHAKGKDVPLPYELKDRINIYVQKRWTTDVEQFKKEAEEYTSFNALVRAEVEKGNI